ncbi:MAG: amidohydrolase family protein [Bacteroidetes bacterium]|jgi:enamidase|nr:amidohydrolase family protein [Bacteroidota bacterium]
MIKKLSITLGIIVILLLIAGWLLLNVFIYPGQEPHSGRTALVNAHFITMATDTSTLIDEQALLIENGHIGSFVPENKLPDDISIVDLDGGYAMPGLFDMHVHMDGIPIAEEYSFPAMWLELKRDFPNIREKFLRYGITTVTSLGDSHPNIVNLRNDIASGKLSGPRLRVAGPLLTAPGGHPVSTIFKGNQQAIETSTRQLKSPKRARSVVDKLAEDNVDLIKVVYSKGNPEDPLPRLNYNVMQAIIDQAHKHNRKVVVHTETQNDVEDAIRAGADGLEHMAFSWTDSLLTEIADEKIVLVPTLTAVESMWNEDLFGSTLTEAFSERIDHNIIIALGTDAAVVPAGESVYSELQLFVEAGMSPYEAFQAATINAAKHANMQDVLGSIEPGKYADIVVFKQNPLEQINDLHPPKKVFKEGKLMVNN